MVMVIAGVAIATLYFIPGSGFGKNETITIAKKQNKQGAIVETTTTTTTQNAKTFWDLLSLVGVPVSLAVLGYMLQRLQQARVEQQGQIEKTRAEEQAKVEKEIAESHHREEALQHYFDRISVLLIDKNLIATATGEIQERIAYKLELSSRIQLENIEHEQTEFVNASRDVIRARTLSILCRLEQDGERKGDVITFLGDTEILSKLKLDLSQINLQGAKLRKANLRDAKFDKADLSNSVLFGASLCNANLEWANLNGADLSGADLTSVKLRDARLSYANFHSANLNHAKLNCADLTNANLIGADLSFANLNSTNLSDTNLIKAYLWDADLQGAKNWTEEQLAQASLCRTKLPEGCNLDPDQDCQELF